jgi:hypothetical protein
MKMKGFYFVVPDWVFESFTKQSFQEEGMGQDNIGQESPVGEQVTQRQLPMKRSLNSIGNSRESKEPKIADTKNEKKLNDGFLTPICDFYTY